jgi:hypothetical protein
MSPFYEATIAAMIHNSGTTYGSVRDFWMTNLA